MGLLLSSRYHAKINPIQEAAEGTAAQIKAKGGVAEAHALNVADHEQCTALLAKLRNEGARIDVLINNGDRIEPATGIRRRVALRPE